MGSGQGEAERARTGRSELARSRDLGQGAEGWEKQGRRGRGGCAHLQAKQGCHEVKRRKRT